MKEERQVAGTIYKIKNKDNNLVYVGKVWNRPHEGRWAEHRTNGYGGGNWEFSVLEPDIATQAELADWETYYILTHRSNHSTYGNNHLVGKLGMRIPNNKLPRPFAVNEELIGVQVRYRWKKQHDWAQIERTGVVKTVDYAYNGQQDYVWILPLTPKSKYLDGECILPCDVLGVDQ